MQHKSVGFKKITLTE